MHTTEAETAVIRRKLRSPDIMATGEESRAICSQIQEAPDAFWRGVAKGYSDKPDGLMECLKDMVTEYRDANVGRGRW